MLLLFAMKCDWWLFMCEGLFGFVTYVYFAVHSFITAISNLT